MDTVINYLFLNPGAPASALKLGIIFGFIAFLFLLFFAIPIIKRKTGNKALKKVVARSRLGLMSFAIGFLFLALVRLEAVPFLSLRIWFVLTIIGFAIWAVWKCFVYRKISRRIERAEARRKKG